VRVAAIAAIMLTGLAAGVALARSGGTGHDNAYVVQRLVSDRSSHAARRDRSLVNAWGLAASPTGPWWTSNEASSTSTLYSGEGRKQLLTVRVEGGPTGIAYYDGKALPVASGRARDPARFIYACEDGMLRAWTPTVPHGWSTEAEVVVDEAAEATVFRGVAVNGDRVYATDFHNARVEVYDGAWHRVRRAGAFTDPRIPGWYAPFGIRVLDGHVFVTYVFRAPVNGNDAPSGGYLDEFDLDGRLVARVAHGGALNAPWGLALAPRSFGHFGGDLLVGNFGDGRINAYRRERSGAWHAEGPLEHGGKPLVISGLWGIAFGNGGLGGPAGTLYFTSGPHTWRGATELGVHGLFGRIVPG
jgi:uncharacterized protein (TIGR03118 family)